MHHICPSCGGNNLTIAVASVGYTVCNECGYRKTAAGISTSGSGNGSLLDALVTLGFIAIGAAFVGALLDSLSNPKRREELPNYDEENWQRLFR